MCVRGGGKFSPTLLVESELEWFIRVSLPHALERMRREEALARSSSSSARPSRHDAPRVAGLSRAELIPMRFFLPVRNKESLTDGATI